MKRSNSTDELHSALGWTDENLLVRFRAKPHSFLPGLPDDIGKYFISQFNYLLLVLLRFVCKGAYIFVQNHVHKQLWFKKASIATYDGTVPIACDFDEIIIIDNIFLFKWMVEEHAQIPSSTDALVFAAKYGSMKILNYMYNDQINGGNNWNWHYDSRMAALEASMKAPCLNSFVFLLVNSKVRLGELPSVSVDYLCSYACHVKFIPLLQWIKTNAFEHWNELAEHVLMYLSHLAE